MQLGGSMARDLLIGKPTNVSQAGNGTEERGITEEHWLQAVPGHVHPNDTPQVNSVHLKKEKNPKKNN